VHEKPGKITSRSLAAEAWAGACELIDRQLSPLGLKAIERLDLGVGDVVLDVGCGAGQTLLQLADRVGAEGEVIGVDIAPQLLEIARRRSATLGRVSLIEADAQSLDLPSASVDAVFSRFGVMAFGDPPAAFANFHRMLRPLGSLAFTCWRSLEENPLDYLPLSAAGLEGMVDEEPFSFARSLRVWRRRSCS
jgi:SAM-dependent methyltransferase